MRLHNEPSDKLRKFIRDMLLPTLGQLSDEVFEKVRTATFVRMDGRNNDSRPWREPEDPEPLFHLDLMERMIYNEVFQSSRTFSVNRFL